MAAADFQPDRYLKVTRWAERRYRDPATGELVLSHGHEPSVYARIEQAAWDRYCRGSQMDRGA